MYRSTSCPVVHLLSLLYSCLSLQFVSVHSSILYSLLSVQSVVYTDGRLLSFMPVGTVYRYLSICKVIRLYCHQSVLTSFCTVALLYSRLSVQFCLYCLPFFIVCNLYRWIPVQLSACTYSVVNLLYSHPFVQSSVSTVGSLYSHQSVQLSVCIVGFLYSCPPVQSAVSTVICLNSRQSVQMVCIVGCLYSSPAVQYAVCTVYLEFFLFCLPSVQMTPIQMDNWTDKITVQTRQLYRQDNCTDRTTVQTYNYRSDNCTANDIQLYRQQTSWRGILYR